MKTLKGKKQIQEADLGDVGKQKGCDQMTARELIKKLLELKEEQLDYILFVDAWGDYLAINEEFLIFEDEQRIYL